jgi:hypothetical protein
VVGSAFAARVGQVDNITVYGISPPGRFEVNGPETGFIETPYEFTVVATEPTNNLVRYQFHWDDGSVSEWSEWVTSGTMTTMYHSYSEPGTYLVGVLEARSDENDIRYATPQSIEVIEW